MKYRLHPILLPFFLMLMVTGGISMYAIIFISLLIHEMGHLIAAKLMGLRVRSCTIMPYGGELVIPNRHQATKKARLIVAFGGPLATFALLLGASFIPFPGDEVVIRIQVALLVLNLLPILPLDGGQALCVLLETNDSRYATRSLFLLHSMALLSVATLLLTYGLPETLPYVCLALFLLFQNISVFRFRKYERAYAELKKSVDVTMNTW
ncbi:site-2 protease family protein [Sporosarcina limicola]|uniref:Stage IV sporulation protein FB n=1 Tax=Sporosarcina limicola TaxID=34101 RepID=A0A927RCP3_9BACL|nr:site-2 protease family protein [Sporosarcina limicola]MBE1554580.1 stage IV sporulation protein FB [Sporosarcina limicola]